MKYTYLFHIDDDEDDSEIFIAASEEVSKTVSVESFNDARKALEKMETVATLPEVVFLDLNMPIMDGFQFLKEIKMRPHLTEIPVIILSTSSNSETIEKVKNMGAEGFITKPSDYNVLVGILKSYLKK